MAASDVDSIRRISQFWVEYIGYDVFTMSLRNELTPTDCYSGADELKYELVERGERYSIWQVMIIPRATYFCGVSQEETLISNSSVSEDMEEVEKIHPTLPHIEQPMLLLNNDDRFNKECSQEREEALPVSKMF